MDQVNIRRVGDYHLTAEDRDMLRDRPVVASVSGGKDSTAMALWLIEQGVEFSAVFMDTEWEHPDTYEYLQQLPFEIETIKPPLGFADLVRKKGMFPGRLVRFCTQELKIKPIKRWIQEFCPDGVVVNAVGIRSAESRARANLSKWEEWADHTNIWIWRPLIDWSEQDVIEIHHQHGLAPNPLYLRQSSRVGCWPCIFARKAEIRAVADETSWRVDEIRDLEAEVQDLARQRYAAKGETFESLGYDPPTFFSRPGMASIDSFVRWSRTSHGGKQFNAFGPEEGCVRWGLCGS